MSIRFTCAKCHHPIEVEDRFAGRPGRCKHCGEATTIPLASGAAGAGPATDAGLKLRPIAGPAEPAAREAPAAPGPALRVRPLAPADDARAAARRGSGVPPADDRPVEVLDPDHLLDPRRPARLNPHYETRAARWAARVLRETRDRLYLLTIGLLVLALLAYLFQAKALQHLAFVGVVLANIAMLVDGLLYLVVLPFRHSLAQGLGTLFPPYAIYYWVKHWDRMRRPVVNTIRSFTPILLVSLAYLLYEEAPLIERGVQEADRAVVNALGGAPAPAPSPNRPTVADQAKQVLGNEANVIQQLAQPE